MKGRRPKLKLDQYRRIVELRRGNTLVAHKQVVELATEFNVSSHTIVSAMHRGIKRYDIELASEAKR